jgi:hypothetical protein
MPYDRVGTLRFALRLLIRVIDAPSQGLSIQKIQLGLPDPGFGRNFD